MIRKIALSLVPLVLVLLAACGEDDGAGVASGSASGSGSGSGSASAAAAESEDCVVVDGTDEEETSEAHVFLDEYAIKVEEDVVEAGVVKIEAMNEGELAHEVVVLAAAADEIEMGEDGAPVEVGFVGEVEAFQPGTECQGSFELEAGTYTLLCAIVEESGESHFGEGMVTELVVE